MINAFFDKIYIITMKKNKERHKYIIDLFEKKNITNYKFIYGIEGENIDTKQYFKKNLIHKWMLNMPNPLGTILTHKDAWQDMIDNNYKQCVFFEDDVYFLDEFDKNFNNFMNHVPEDWAVLQLGWIPPSFRYKDDIEINNYVLKKWSSVSGAHFYALNNKSAPILIDNLYPIKKAVDGYIGDMTNPWTKQRGINLQAYAPIKCFAVDCSHNHGNTVKFNSHGIA